MHEDLIGDFYLTVAVVAALTVAGSIMLLAWGTVRDAMKRGH